MAQKKVNYDFFTINYGDGIKKDMLSEQLEKELGIVNAKKLNNVKVFDFTARVRHIEKRKINKKLNEYKDNYYWVVSIERLNTNDEAYVGDLNGARDTYGQGPDQGPLTDTVFLFNPLNGVLILQRSRGGMGMGAFTKYLSKLTGAEDLTLEIIVDPNTISKLNKISAIKSIEYKISPPTNFKSFSKETRSFQGDLQLAKKLSGANLKVVIGAEKGEVLNKENAVKKIKSFLNAEVDASVLRVNGQISGEVEVLDLISKKIVYTKVFNLTKGKKVTFVNLLDALEDAYNAKKTLLNTLYINEKSE